MLLNLFEFELLFEVINDEVNVKAVLAGVDIGGKESAFRKRMNTDMAFGDDDEAAPPSRVFQMVVGSGDDERLREHLHLEDSAKLGETRYDCLFAI